MWMSTCSAFEPAGGLFEGVECAIFDLDGTLVRSDSAWKSVDEEFMGRRGLKVPDGFYDKISTMNLSQAADYVIAECGIRATRQEVVDEWLSMVRREYAEVIPMVTGAKEFLSRVHDKGCKIALATASSPELYLPCLERHGVAKLFDAYANTSEVKRKKGFPDIYLLAADKVGANPQKCVVFEDIYLGCVGAKAAGMKCIGITEESPDSMQKLKTVCDLAVKDYSELKIYLQ